MHRCNDAWLVLIDGLSGTESVWIETIGIGKSIWVQTIHQTHTITWSKTNVLDLLPYLSLTSESVSAIGFTFLLLFFVFFIDFVMPCRTTQKLKAEREETNKSEKINALFFCFVNSFLYAGLLFILIYVIHTSNMNNEHAEMEQESRPIWRRKKTTNVNSQFTKTVTIAEEKWMSKNRSPFFFCKRNTTKRKPNARFSIYILCYIWWDESLSVSAKTTQNWRRIFIYSHSAGVFVGCFFFS